MEKIEKHEGKQYLIVHDYRLDKITQYYRIRIEKFDDAEILIDSDDKLPDDIALTNFVILMTRVIKDKMDEMDKMNLSSNTFRRSIVC